MSPKGEIAIDLMDGFSWDAQADAPRFKRIIGKQYDIGTNPAYVINDIRKFYNMQIVAWVQKNCRFAMGSNEYLQTLLSPKGEYPGVGSEDGDLVSNGISVFRNPNGKYKLLGLV